ncbi:putative Pollike protein, partial [Globisporangium splendens]
MHFHKVYVSRMDPSAQPPPGSSQLALGIVEIQARCDLLPTVERYPVAGLLAGRPRSPSYRGRLLSGRRKRAPTAEGGRSAHTCGWSTQSEFLKWLNQWTRSRSRGKAGTASPASKKPSYHKLFVNDPGANSSTQTTGRSGGVLTVLRSDFPGFDTAVELPDLTVPGHCLVIRVSVGDAPVYIHNVYSPVDDSDKRVFFDRLRVDMFEDNAAHVVLGDLNAPLDPSVGSSQPSLRARPGRSACLGWLGQLGVVDPWRIHHPDERVYTGPQPRKNRLDYILMSEDFSNAVYGDAKYFEPKGAGDHLVHQVTLRSVSQLQGRGYWRFPAYLLEYPEVVEAVRGEAQQVLRDLQAASNPGKVWEQWKKSIRRQLQALQRKLRSQNEAAVEAARRTLDEAANRYREDRHSVSQTGFHAALEAYRDCVNRSSCYNRDAAFDFQAQHAEASSKYFFRPLDTSLRRVSIEGVQTSDGRVSCNSQDISAVFRAHWGPVMGDPDSPAGPTPPTNSSSRRKLLDTIDRRLPTEEQDLLNAPISGVDLADALKHMKASSAPGMDGLTAGFYQVATDVFGECLSIVFNCQLVRGELLYSQRQSAVCLLHKKGSRADPGNFRPISLVGVDVKALSKTLTYRLQLFLPKLIHADQKAFAKGRSIHHHVRFLADVQDLVTARDEEAYAMFLDFEKAYDRVNWDYMFQVLDRMGCGGAFSDWVKLLCTSLQAHLLINGHIQPAICPTRGVKQGDPLSALLFLVVIEPLGNLLRQHEEHGICLAEDHTVPGLFFADGSTLLSGSVQGIQAQLDLVQEYCDGSGAKLNLNKCILMPLHRRRDAPDIPSVKVLQRGENVKFLGLLFGQDTTDDAIIEFLDRRFYEGFLLWFRRARTLRGRLLVALTMVLSRLWHYMVHVPVPDRIVKKWQSASLKRQKLQLLLQFVAASTSTTRNWTTPGRSLLSLALPHWGPWQPLDFPTISPLRHGALLKWCVLSQWRRVVWRLWHSLKWEVTWRDLNPPTRLAHLLRQPIWFHVSTANNTEIPRAPSQLLSIVWKPPTPNNQHPIQLHHYRTTADDIKRFVRLFKRLRKILLPVYEDLQYRLAVRLLPVRSRFTFLREAHPQIIYCIRDGCSTVETERHLFFECVLPSELWPVMFRDWSSFFTYTPKWIDIVLGRRPTPTDAWKEHIAMLGDLWQITRAIVLHFVWTVRNDCLFRQRVPTPLLPALRVIYTTFSSHVRATMRRAQSEEDQASTKCVLNQLPCSRSLGGFMHANSQLFAVMFLNISIYLSQDSLGGAASTLPSGHVQSLRLDHSTSHTAGCCCSCGPSDPAAIVEMINNYVHSTSGRSPKLGGSTDPNTDVVVHAANNYWADNSGHSFDVAEKAFVLMEGNYFESTANPNLQDSTTTGSVFVPTSSNQNYCKLYLGRNCQLNVLETSGPLSGRQDSVAIARLKDLTGNYVPTEAKKLDIVTSSFDVGTLK